MPLELWITFALASAALLAIPGPTVMLVVSYALGRGRATGWASVPGVALGDFTAMTASLLGAGALLAASATAFTVLKIVGAAYLIWLGIKLWRAKPEIGDVAAAQGRGGNRAIFWHAWVVPALNPKGHSLFRRLCPAVHRSRRQHPAAVRDPGSDVPHARDPECHLLGSSRRHPAGAFPQTGDPAFGQSDRRQFPDRGQDC